MNSYFFYYFNEFEGAIPFFEVVNCSDDEHAVIRCRDLLKFRKATSAEVWVGERLVSRILAAPGDPCETAQLAPNPPHPLASLAP